MGPVWQKTVLGASCTHFLKLGRRGLAGRSPVNRGPGMKRALGRPPVLAPPALRSCKLMKGGAVFCRTVLERSSCVRTVCLSSIHR